MLGLYGKLALGYWNPGEDSVSYKGTSFESCNGPICFLELQIYQTLKKYKSIKHSKTKSYDFNYLPFFWTSSIKGMRQFY